MKKYLGALVVVLAMAFVVARQDQHAADQATQIATERHKAAVASANEPHAQENVGKSNGDRPRWYVLYIYPLFRWHEGTEIWAIILTLLAIAEQTQEVRRSVDVATKALIIASGPKVAVRTVRLDPSATVYYDRRNEGTWAISINLTNTGGTEAKVKKYEAFFQMYSHRGVPIDTIGVSWTSPFDKEFILSPGGRHVLRGLVTDAQAFRNSLHSLESSTTEHQVHWRQPVCHGKITYVDGNGRARDTGFMREWKLDAKYFVVVDDPEYEYQD